MAYSYIELWYFKVIKWMCVEALFCQIRSQLCFYFIQYLTNWSLHTKFEENCSSHFQDTSEQNFFLISLFSSSFCTLRKIHHKTRMRAPIGLKFGTCKGFIKVDCSTNFGRNPININRVMTDYLHKIRSKVCHTHKVNLWEE